VAVTLVDRHNHHTFQPFLYQVATAGLSPAEIAAPIRTILRDYRNVSVLLGEVVDVDTVNRRVLLEQVSLTYDYLIVAAGATHSYFGHDEWAPLAPGLKGLEDALEIRRRILLAFEMAESQARLSGSHQPLHIAVVGGGPTGVELAGTLAEITRRTLAKDFRYLDPGKTQITIIEGLPRLLPAYTEDLSRYAQPKTTVSLNYFVIHLS
jgi:NADH dehydrogenase